jgi:hypothetical protein
MSTTALTNLRDYLTGTLSTADMMWLVEEMKNFLRGSEEELKPYTMEEINAMLDEAEADFDAGLGIPHEEVMREWKEEIAREEQKEYELAEAV